MRIIAKPNATDTSKYKDMIDLLRREGEHLHVFCCVDVEFFNRGAGDYENGTSPYHRLSQKGEMIEFELTEVKKK